ncbi:hypothetical protein CesoFtcFv8_011941 [Champsocephalus esox]|uniref:Uncharacterized protein n=1 Tax=Champsocephalus esox TaxID=159716 RepID=A0AAN8H0Y2_9TELE|nr:hypothetical protein CesoFtcFv8_011941 [Champsocephalus esox]
MKQIRLYETEFILLLLSTPVCNELHRFHKHADSELRLFQSVLDLLEPTQTPNEVNHTQLSASRYRHPEP